MVTDIRRSLAMLGFGATLATFAVPLVCISLYMQSKAPPALLDASFSAGKPMRDGAGFSGTDIWAQPADIDLTTVECTRFDANGEDPTPLPIGAPKSGPTSASDGRGTFAYLTTAGRPGDWISSAQCAGPGLELLAISRYEDRALKRRLAILLPIAMPILFMIGRTIRRSGARISGSHVPPRA